MENIKFNLRAEVTFMPYSYDVIKLLEEFIKHGFLNTDEVKKINFFKYKVDLGKRLDIHNINELKKMLREKNLYNKRVDYFFNQRF